MTEIEVPFRTINLRQATEHEYKCFSAFKNALNHEYPEVEFIRTDNASSNAPVLKINNEIGFKLYFANTIWQVETEKIEKYLLEKQE